MPESLLLVPKLREQRKSNDVKEKIEVNKMILRRISTSYHLGFARHHNPFYAPQISIYLRVFEILAITN
jgi:hypothetical protein